MRAERRLVTSNHSSGLGGGGIIRVWIALGMLSAALLAVTASAADWVSVLAYLPDNPVLDGSIDYREQFNQALAENVALLIPGSADPDKPLVYGMTTGVKIPEGHVLKAQPNSILKRLPSKGKLLHVGRRARVIGVTVDANKYAHWPQFKDLGKSDGAFLLLGGCVVEDCTAYDVPGIAFMCYSDNNIVRNCKARNCGYIDLKFNADFYQGKWDQWSGDGFYFRGHDNLIIDCEAIDCFRWAYTTCHEKAGRATYINCKGSAVNWRPYGFIDIEGCDGGGSTLINCVGTFGSIAISTSGTRMYHCEAKSIHVYNADDVEIIDCTTRGGGLGVGGWSSAMNSTVRGGNNPVVVGNTINKHVPTSGISSVSDWSLSVFSADGRGLVANNVLNEYDGPEGKGPGMKLDKVSAHNNIVTFRTPQLPTKPKKAPGEESTSLKARLRQRQLREFAAQVPNIARELGLNRKITNVTVIDPDALFIKDHNEKGETEGWFESAKRPPADTLKRIQLGKHWDDQHGQYHGHAWYFASFTLDQDHRFIADQAHLLFGGVDSDCRVFLNGQFLGEHNGWKDPFLMEIPKALLRWEDQGANDIAIHVWTPAGLGGVYRHVAALLSQEGEPAQQPAEPEKPAQPVVVQKDGFVADFSKTPKDLALLHRATRVGFAAKNAPYPDARLQLRGGGFALSKQSFGPGIYHVRFVLNESQKKFAYHKASFAFYFQGADKTAGKNDIANLQEHLSLTWESGKLVFEHQEPATPDGKRGARTRLGIGQIPGPDSPAILRKDEPLDLTVAVPDPGGEVCVYLRKKQPTGEPDCTFTMPAQPAAGSFGFINHKWHSYIYLDELRYSP
ncbi:MAG: beta galactosidase jelly roll domain-containing protein [Lentisphaeria bacterium]|nr:beta galactosidase jelly roll domain-containing protein [Lentisphaeria bacterium]